LAFFVEIAAPQPGGSPKRQRSRAGITYTQMEQELE
jgi:hypothetical protein